ncbi:DsbA family protein [Pseudocolwellia agarivorans]|uniref:DsbA family protein n=1 Tax=Pseudocolwellia agarivorans TaxID=1911682 RepID=UPI0009865F26|nr:DsbA family protein [Pseudocolwellia agarivorans]
MRRSFLTYKFYTLPLFFGNTPIADVYLSLNDPHSFMLVQVLADIEKRFNLTFRLYLVAETTPSLEVNIPLLKQWAIKDANYIADKYNLSRVNSFPNTQALVTGQQTWLLNVKNVQDALNVFNDTWFDNYTEHFPLSTPVITAQINNQRRLFRRGSHSTGSIFFCGEWFLGIDRLEHLEFLFNDKGLSKENETVVYNKNTLQLLDNTTIKSKENSLEAYISLNSPFSYIGLVQAKKLSDKYQVPLTIKPLVPISMRGVVIPEYKQRYMLLDAAREAKKLNINFKGYVDPLKQGVINIYEIFMYAEQQKKSYQFMQAAFEAVFVGEIDLALDKHIRKICAQIDINYEDAIEYGKINDWQLWSEKNHLSLNNMGLWGVPCFKYKEVSCWGQDRLVQIEDAILAS